jgi:DNA polymerase
MATTLAIDIETYSSADIRYGVYKYADSPDFEILLLGYAFDDEPVQVADLTREEVPARFVQALFDRSVTKTAFNANFEMTCLRKLYPDMPLECWECTSILSLYNSLPTGLANVAKILKLGADKQKDARGKALINYFSKPCKPTKANGGRTRNRPEDAPDKWAEYIEYNRQDVVVERAIRQKLLRLKPTETEHRYWLMDQWINGNGAKVDMQLVRNAIRMNQDYSAHLREEAVRITGLENPNSVAQLKRWVEDRIGETVTALDKKAVTELLEREDIPGDVRRVLEIRQLMGRTSIKKYEAMAQAVCSDGRIHGMFQFYGAMRTGRWAGRIVQLHNLPRSSMPIDELRAARDVVLRGDLEELEILWDNVPDVLSQLVRTAIVAEDGCRFIVDDYSAIEARVIAWLAGEKWRQDVFAKGGDIYCASASAMFGVPVVKHGVNGHLRQKGKIAELALGYGGGIGALKAMGADKMGLTDEELIDIVTKWRRASPAIVRFWWAVDAAVRKAVWNPGEIVTIRQGHLRFHCRFGALFIEHPSGRHLVYVHPHIGQNRFGGEAILYAGMEQGTRTWGELETYGGKLVENIVQATARDCLAAAMLRLKNAGYKILMHVHDEVIMEVPKDKGSMEEVTRIMSMNEPWEKGLVKNADGFEDIYYRKD